MRRLLAASTVLLGAAGMIGTASAQTAPNPMNGQLVAPPGKYVGANNNNNAFGTARPGPAGTPTPGTMVIHLGGRVMVEYYEGWNSLMNSVPGANTTSNQMSSYLRLYPGMDAMAANGMRYGAAMEIRVNNGTPSTPSTTNPASGASGFTNGQTLYLRRAFVYLGTDQIGIFRAGTGDGLISLFDQGITTMQTFSPTSVFNGSDLGGAIGGNTAAPWVFLSGSGDEYDTQKIVYLSPNFSGFDFGLSYSPSAFSSLNGCTTPATTCSNLTSSGTAANGGRFKDLVGAGVRYSGPIGPINLHTYAVYQYGGHVGYSGTPASARAQVGAPASSTWNGSFDNLNFGSMGAAVTYAGVTVGANFITGAMNGRLTAKPSGGANVNGVIAGIQYKTGALTIGTAAELINSQGAVALTGLTQRQEYAIDIGGSYGLAPGLVLFADYIYQNRKQSGWNFATNAVGTANNQVHGQGFVFGTMVSW